MIKNDYYETNDLGLATVLSMFFTLDCVDKTNPQKATFLFKREKALEETVEAFWRRELKVEPQQYFQQLKMIKSRLYEK